MTRPPMNDINAVRRIFLFAAAAYLVLAVPHLHAMQPAAGYVRTPSLGDVIANVEAGMTRLAEAQQETNAFFPGN